MADNTDSTPPDSITSLVGYDDGEVLPSGETVIYDYDEDGQFIGWHKGKA